MGRMRGKLTRGRRIQFLHYLANDDGCVALKPVAEDREGCQTCCTAEDYYYCHLANKDENIFR